MVWKQGLIVKMLKEVCENPCSHEGWRLLPCLEVRIQTITVTHLEFSGSATTSRGRPEKTLKHLSHPWSLFHVSVPSSPSVPLSWSKYFLHCIFLSIQTCLPLLVVSSTLSGVDMASVDKVLVLEVMCLGSDTSLRSGNTVSRKWAFQSERPTFKIWIYHSLSMAY